MDTLQKLIRLEQNYRKIEEGKKLVKNDNHMYILKKMKNDFERVKAKYLEKKEQIEEIKNEYIKISSKINSEKEEMKNVQNKLYNQYGSDVRMIEKCEKQIKNHKTAINEMESNFIELLEKEDALKLEREKLRQELINLKNDFHIYKESTTNKIIEAKKNIKEGEKVTAILESELPEKILLEYKSIRKDKNSAVVPVKNGVCAGCKIKLSAITIGKLNKNKELIYCDNCERIVYLPEK